MTDFGVHFDAQFHGINHEDQLEMAKICMPVVKEWQAQGKIKHIGFSTHAMTTTILNAIETDLFDYVNLHYQFIGSNTATGTGSLGAISIEESCFPIEESRFPNQESSF